MKKMCQFAIPKEEFRSNYQFPYKCALMYECRYGPEDSKAKTCCPRFEMGLRVKAHAAQWEIITEKGEFVPLLVLNAYFEQHYLDLFNDGQITEEELSNSGTGYVDAVGINGIVQRLQYYEYMTLKQNDVTKFYKDTILNSWKCENISYTVMKRLEPNE